MHTPSFITTYKQLSAEQKEKLDELIAQQDEKEEQLAELADKLRTMSFSERDALEQEQDEFLERMCEEEREVDTAVYTTDDPEEAFTLREMDYATLQEERYEVLTTSFPMGLDILENEIEQIESEMCKVLPKPPVGVKVTRFCKV